MGYSIILKRHHSGRYENKCIVVEKKIAEAFTVQLSTAAFLSELNQSIRDGKIISKNGIGHGYRNGQLDIFFSSLIDHRITCSIYKNRNVIFAIIHVCLLS